MRVNNVNNKTDKLLGAPAKNRRNFLFLLFTLIINELRSSKTLSA